MECCLNKLGRFPHNQPLKLGINAAQTGKHIFYMTAPTGGRFDLSIDFETGDELIIPVGQLNESMTYKFKIQNPDESFVSVDTCENFELLTFINTQLNGCNEPCDVSPATYYGS